MIDRGVQGVQGVRGAAGVQEGRDNDLAPIFENRWPALAFPFAITNENVLEITSEIYFTGSAPKHSELLQLLELLGLLLS